MLSHTIWIEPDIMQSKQHLEKFIEFCSSICTKIIFAAHFSVYNLSSDEYTNALNDFHNIFKKEDENRRNRFLVEEEYRINLLNTYHTEDKVTEYFDRVVEYNLIELGDIKKKLIQYINRTTDTKFPQRSKKDKNNLVKKEITLPKENYLRSRFTMYSHSTIGGLYKIYEFKMDSNMSNYLLNEGDLLKLYTFDMVDILDDPGFYSDDILVCSICSHERSTVLYLQEVQYKTFLLLEIPHSVSTI